MNTHLHLSSTIVTYMYLIFPRPFIYSRYQIMITHKYTQNKYTHRHNIHCFNRVSTPGCRIINLFDLPLQNERDLKYLFKAKTMVINIIHVAYCKKKSPLFLAQKGCHFPGACHNNVTWVNEWHAFVTCLSSASSSSSAEYVVGLIRY